MKRYFIENAKCGITAGGMACGPIPGHVVTSIKYNDSKESKWLNLVEVDGIPNLFLTDDDIYEDLIRDDYENDAFYENLNEHAIDEFNGITFDDDYYGTFASIADNPDNPAAPLIRYLIALVRCRMEDTESVIQLGTNKYADELDIPASDVEQDYLEDNED